MFTILWDGQMEKVSEIMDKKLVAISHDASLKSALKLAKTAGVGMLPILDGDRLVGMVGTDDIQHYISKDPGRGEESVDTLSKAPVFLEANETRQSAMAKIIKNGLSRMPVVESRSTMRCLGTVNSTDLLKASADDQSEQAK